MQAPITLALAKVTLLRRGKCNVSSTHSSLIKVRKSKYPTHRLFVAAIDVMVAVRCGVTTAEDPDKLDAVTAAATAKSPSTIHTLPVPERTGRPIQPPSKSDAALVVEMVR